MFYTASICTGMYVTGNGNSQVFEVGGKKCNFFGNTKLPILPGKKNASKCIGDPPFSFSIPSVHSTEKQQRAETNDVHSSAPFVSGCRWDVIRSNAGGDWQAKWSARVVNIEKHNQQHSQTRVCCKPCDKKFGGTGKRRTTLESAKVEQGGRDTRRHIRASA